MTYLIVNEYTNQVSKNLDMRDCNGERIQIKTTPSSMYRVGDFVNVDIINKKQVIDSKVIRPSNYLDYYDHGPFNTQYLQAEIMKYVEKIADSNIKLIVEELLEDENYFIYPAAKTIHHAYIGGVATHSLSMLNLSDSLIAAYNLDQDLIYAGIILHDYGKVRELESLGLTYTVEGNLLGHLMIGYELICNTMFKYDIAETEKTMLLKHMIISHHGRLDYGSPKEPMTVEAYILAHLDEMDAKVNLLQTSLKNVEAGQISGPINAFDRRRFYKTKDGE
ncbi:HD domain-containing protein [Mollicutes bacterium LVI A0039]|nr:HD domain-containing protein [Mollicutes bacterium LVI A0039]